MIFEDFSLRLAEFCIFMQNGEGPVNGLRIYPPLGKRSGGSGEDRSPAASRARTSERGGAALKKAPRGEFRCPFGVIVAPPFVLQRVLLPLPGGTLCYRYGSTRSMFRVPLWAPPFVLFLYGGYYRGAKNPLTRGRHCLVKRDARPHAIRNCTEIT
jgi:hypothetical protein